MTERIVVVGGGGHAKVLVDAIEAVAALCNHVHLPVQSGSSRVLEAMLREYTREEYLERIAWFTNRPHQSGYENTALVTDSGSLTSVGAAYAALPSLRTTS